MEEVKMRAKKTAPLWPKIKTPFFWALAMAALLWWEVPDKLFPLVEQMDFFGQGAEAANILMPALSVVLWVVLLGCAFNILWKLGQRLAAGLKNNCAIPQQATLWLVRLILIWAGLALLESVLDDPFNETLRFLMELLGDEPRSRILDVLFPVVPLLFGAILLYLAVLLLVVLIRLLQKAVRNAQERSRRKKMEREAEKVKKEEEKRNQPVQSKPGRSGMLDQQAKNADGALKAYRDEMKPERGADYLWVKMLGADGKDEILLWARDELYVETEKFNLTLRKENGRAWLLGEERVELFPNAPCVGYVESGDREFRQLILTYIKGE